MFACLLLFQSGLGYSRQVPAALLIERVADAVQHAFAQALAELEQGAAALILYHRLQSEAQVQENRASERLRCRLGRPLSLVNG
jgi:hypothetical protein